MATIKNRAKYHKVVSTKSIRDIIDESNQDTPKPKPTNMSNHVNGMRRLI